MAYKGILGAVFGDIVGSRFEFNNIKTKEFELYNERCFFTDDSVMTLAVGKALMECYNDYSELEVEAIKSMQQIGKEYFDCDYGGSFRLWLLSPNPIPYRSWGNGAAMRVSGCAYFATSLEEAKELSYKVTAVTHNHEEGIKGAEATTVATYMALHGSSKDEIRDYITNHYYPLDFTLDEIRDDYNYDVSCQGSVPQALQAFFEATDYEDAIRNAISIGGDSDTIAAIAGAVACAYYGVPNDIKEEVSKALDDKLINLAQKIDKAIEKKIEKMIKGFDEIIELPLVGETIQYGIVNGSNTIVFIKAGANGSMHGYKNKYLQIARNINKSHGYTVICSSNPDYNRENPLNQAIELIANYSESNNFDDYEILYMGHSDGAALAARYGYMYPKIKKMLMINPPLFFDWQRIKEGMQQFEGEKAVFVYGELDPSHKHIEMLDQIENKRIEWKIIKGADHHFTGMLDEFMNLPYEFLL